MCTPRYDITLDQFMRVAHLLPRQRGNVAVDNHTFVNALLWMCRTGAPWRDPPERHGKWITVYQRFNRWSGNGATRRLFTALQEERIIKVEIRVPAMDSTSVKVHRHAAGAPKRGAPGPSASPGEGGTPKFTWYPTARARSSRSIRARATSATRPTGAARWPRSARSWARAHPWTARTRGIPPGCWPSRSA